MSRLRVANKMLLNPVPPGGSTGQVLGKTSAVDYAMDWTTPAAGGLTLPLTQPLTFSPDATQDIGAAAASRPRDLYLSRNAVVGGTLNVSGVTTLGALTATGALSLPAGSVAPGFLAAGAAASNVGALGGALSGTLPNPTLAANAVGSTQITDGSVTSAKIADGTIAAADMAAGAAASNVGTLGGSLTGTLPNPGIAANAVGTTHIADGSVTAAKLASGAAASNVGALGGVLSGTLPNPSHAANAVTKVIYDQDVATSDVWSNTSLSSGYNGLGAISGTLISLDAGVAYLLVILSCSAYWNGTPASVDTVVGWGFAVQNTLFRGKLSRIAVRTGQVQMVAVSTTIYVPPSAWGTGSGGRQFGPMFYAANAMSGGWYLRGSTSPDTDYVRMTIIEVFT